jgi:hypothetical protein
MINRRAFSVSSTRLFPQRLAIVSSDWLENRNYRLDPTHYNERGEKVARHLRYLPLRKTTLGEWEEINSIYIPPRFKRPYIESQIDGIPFLGSSSMLAFRLPKDALLAPSFNKIPDLMVYGGEILLSCSGTIGEAVLCGESYRGFTVSQHAARIRANVDVRGYLYAYLVSPLGRELVLQQNYGKVIKELTEEQIKKVVIPILDDGDLRRINDNILEAVSLFDRARISLLRAEEELMIALRTLGLKNNAKNWINRNNFTFLKDSDNLFNSRLDPHYHDPNCNILRESIKQFDHKCLGDIADIWMPNRFARPHAEAGYGTSFYSSAEIMRARPIANSTISIRAEKNLEQCKIEHKMILLCRSGAFGGIMGHTTFASRLMDGWAVTEDMVRCRVHKDPAYLPEYVFALLSSLDIGYPMVTSFRYGKDVPHIDSGELGSIPIPFVKEKIQEKIAIFVTEAFNCRDKANEIENLTQNYLLEKLMWSENNTGPI